MKFSPTSSPPLWCNVPCPFMDKGHQTIITSLWLNSKFCTQTILENPQNFEAWCIARIQLFIKKMYEPMNERTSHDFHY